MAYLNRCCKFCKDGSLDPRWQNVTKVRPAGDTLGPNYTSAPFPRLDSSDPDSGCSDDDTPAGTCGGWIVSTALNSLSARLDAGYEDIQLCAGGDASHRTMDMNCYQTVTDTAGSLTPGVTYKIVTVGTTDFTLIGAAANLVGTIFVATDVGSGTGTAQQMVDTRGAPRFGGKWLLARKWHQGRLGIMGVCDPKPITGMTFDAGDPEDGHAGFTGDIKTLNLSAPQNHYLTLTVSASSTITNNIEGDPDNGATAVSAWTSSSSINRFTGVETRSASFSENVLTGEESVRPLSAGWDYVPPVTEMAAWTSDRWMEWFGAFREYASAASVTYANPSANVYHLVAKEGTDPVLPSPVAVIEEVSVGVGSGSRTAYNFEPTFDGDGVQDGWTVVTILTELATWSDTGVTYSFANANHPLGVVFSLNVTFSDAYSSAECFSDFLELEKAWSLSNAALGAFRTDEQLANAPLVIRDEIQNQQQPSANVVATLDDYSGALTTDENGVEPGGDGYIITWPQRDWIDPNDYTWIFPDGSLGQTPPDGFTGGATLHTPFFSGAIIAANAAGSERSFWFGHRELRREPQIVDGEPTGNYLWVFDKIGLLSDDYLPTPTLRWMNRFAAQYDALLAVDGGGSPPPGNLPQAFLRQQAGVIVGAKYVECPIEWPAVNYARPCGPDKYAVDQLTVACVTGADDGSFTVTKPPTTGDFPTGGYVIVTGDFNPGIYPVTGISGTGPWTIGVGAKIDDVPTGWTHTTAGNYLGWLRWPSAPGICGRVAITTTHDDDTNLLTITATVAQPYLRLDPATGEICVDIYDAAMTLLASNVNVTRMDDSNLTITHAALPAANFIMTHGVAWPVPDATSKHTGIKIEWTFNPRATDADYPDPPTWYAGMAGCTNGTITQFNYVKNPSCPPVVGIVPGGGSGAENFTNQVLYGFPAEFPFDDAYSAVWMANVELTMVDPFWQPPFKPQCGTEPEDVFAWKEDDGSGLPDAAATDTEAAKKYFAHHPLVEAAANVPAGLSLPSGVTLFYDPSVEIAQQYYPFGLPIGDVSGNYGGFERPWGFFGAACATMAGGGRFAADYAKLVLNCPS